MKKLTLLVASTFLLFSNSFALDLKPAIGISYNTAVYAAEGTERGYNAAGAQNSLIEEYGAFADEHASIFAELNLNEHIAIGIDYVPQSISTPENTSRDGFATDISNKVQVDFEDHLTIYSKINTPLGGTYLKLGYSQVDIVVNETMNSGSVYRDTDTNGYHIGIGYEHAFGTGLSLRAEVMGSQYDDAKTDNNTALDKNEVEVSNMIGATGTIALVKTF